MTLFSIQKNLQNCDPTVQEALRADTKPYYGMLSHNHSPNVKEPKHYISLAVAFDCGASAGTVEPKSGDFKEPPVIDPKFLSHPFDHRVAVESVRQTIELLQQPNIAKDEVRLAVGPQSTSEEDIMFSGFPGIRNPCSNHIRNLYARRPRACGTCVGR